MKILFTLLVIVFLSLQAPAHAQSLEKILDSNGIDETERFIFYSVLEGLYEDGLTKKDVEQILMRKEKTQAYFHFIYSCPVCGPTIWALEAYQGRPERLYGLKRPGSTFGEGLSAKLHEQLYSEDAQQRLTAINTLVRDWIERRMKNMRLSDKERTALVKSIDKRREVGMNNLKRFREEKSAESMAPAYVTTGECAVCNGAVGKPMKAQDAKPRDKSSPLDRGNR